MSSAPKPDALERIAIAFEVFDRRLASLEKDSADEAAYAEIMAGRVEEIDGTLLRLDRKVSMLVVIALDDSLDLLEAMLSNYMDASGASRQETARLQSEVREKLKAVP